MPLLRAIGRTVLVLIMLAVTSDALLAQQKIVPGPQGAESHAQRVARINGGRVGIISGGIGGTYIRIATDLASVLDDGDNLRILPLAGKGSIQNIIDILYLRGIDIGIVQSDVLRYLQQQPGFTNISNRISYVTKLYNEEFHLVGSNSIKSVQDLAGKKVNFGVKGSGTFMTASTVFQALRIPVQPVNFDQALALEKIRTGEIAATVYVAGKPARAIESLKASNGYRLIPVPYTRNLQTTYLPASFSPTDYPDLLGNAPPVDTIAVGAVMAVFNWRQGNSRYNRVVKFVEAFFSKFQEFQKPPRHKKWREVNLNAKLPGWKRFAPAGQWLAANSPGRPAASASRKQFEQFVASRSAQLIGGSASLTQSQQEALFQEFVLWKKQIGR